MWNSPHSHSDAGKRYKLSQISAVILPLDELLDASKYRPIAEIVDETILRRLERDEFIFALYQVLEALLEDVEKPEKGHTGIQEAIVAELLSQLHGKICCELDDPEFGYFAREAAWNSLDQLVIKRDSPDSGTPFILEEIGFDISAPQPYLSEKLTFDIWHELLLSEGYLWHEFLWDDDWRMDSLMDLAPDAAEKVTSLAGIDLDVVQALPHTPNSAELRMAEHYISYLILKDDVIHNRMENYGGA